MTLMTALQHSEWIKNIKECDTVDLFDDDEIVQSWCYVKVIGIDNDTESISVHLYGWGNNYDEWITKNNSINKLAPLNTYTSRCVMLNPPNEPYYKATLYENPKDSKKYIICLSDHYVVKYDMSTKKYEIIATLPNHIDYNINAFEILIKDNKLFILYIHYYRKGNKLFASILSGLDHETPQWQVVKSLITIGQGLDDHVDNPVYLGAYSNEKSNIIHLLFSILDATYHLRWDVGNTVDKCDILPKTHANADLIHFGFEFKYADSLNGKGKLIMMQQRESESPYELYWYNVDTSQLHQFESLDGYIYEARNAICVYDDLWLVFGDEGIWIADLKYNKWYKEKKIMPGFFATQIVNTKDNYIHFIGGFDILFHLKVDLIDLIPKHLMTFHSKCIHHNVVTKWMNYHIRKMNLLSKYPYELNTIIAAYYPVFLY